MSSTLHNEKEGNQDIALFMGGSIVGEEHYEMPHGSRSEGRIQRWKFIEGVPLNAQEYASIGIFWYHTSWEWLWPVIDKIESLGYEFVISRRGIQVWRHTRAQEATDLIIDEDFLEDYVGDQKLRSAWDCCISFILWYNKQK